MFSYSRESLISLSSMRMMKYKRYWLLVIGYWLLVIGYWLLESYHDKVIYQNNLELQLGGKRVNPHEHR
ncbi:Uncharacterised protein [Vibrio cholerae]|nr:Uncharacterised protein [Vibrio cholerae]